jgi:hypothetical protein
MQKSEECESAPVYTIFVMDEEKIGNFFFVHHKNRVNRG